MKENYFSFEFRSLSLPLFVQYLLEGVPSSDCDFAVQEHTHDTALIGFGTAELLTKHCVVFVVCRRAIRVNYVRSYAS